MENKMIKEIDFSGVVNWDVKNYFRQFNVFKKDVRIVPFGFFITKPEIEKVKIEDSKEYRILGVRSYGKGAYINREVKGSSLKMRTYQLAKKDRLFWCKVDTKNGAFGIINEELEDGVASSNMTFADINTQKADTEYIQILFRSTKVNEYMDGYVTGTTNRKYIKPDQLREEIKIPLPPKVEQDRIVATYNQKIKLAKRQEEKAKQLEQDIETYLFEALGIEKLEENVSKKGLQFVSFKELVDWNSSNKNVAKYYSSKYELTSILINETISESVFRGKSPKYDKDSKSFILNQKCNRWNYLELKHSKKVNDQWFENIDKKFFTKEGDILINSTGEGTIGRSTYVTKENAGLLYDSHILLLRLNNSIVNPLFYSYLFNSNYGQSQVEDIKSAQSTKQTELGVNNLKKILLPLPESIDSQVEIANHISGLKSEIKKLREQAVKNRKQAITDFENEIFS
ncbi:restriction endonuclease subunit S [Tenacibaculum maritimum]|uniref:restriction endonuclease subunit S n=1 Tax=Tenacibaculum maritimum TaxID=107401 RepID=UPI0038780FF1